VRRVWANVMGPNIGSSRVLEKAGYQLIYAKMRPN
jgi:RimJ/RimL family protein N-acetyltransferase